MNFQQAEQYLLSLSNLPRQEYMKDPKKCGVYLERTKFFLKLLGSPEKKIPHYIHITGTSGKGSVACFMESILRASGKKTGLLTSPHATKITERWQVSGKQMSDAEFVRIVKEIKPKLDKYLRESPHDMISFHELTDVIGFYYFARKGVRWGILEVGLGGRFCSSNVIDKKDVAVITNIGTDHKDIIGPTKADICREKAGIITGQSLVFTMERAKEMIQIINAECKEKGAALITAESPKYKILNYNPKGISYKYDISKYSTSIIGKHQIKNAIFCTQIARALKISEASIVKGLKNAKLPLRMEVVSRNPLIILDGAHNTDKISTTVETIKQLEKSMNTKLDSRIFEPSNRHLVIGFSDNKNWRKMIKQLSELKPKSVACTRNTINLFRRVADPKLIKNEFKKNLSGIKSEIFLDPAEALSWSVKHCKKNDILLVTGSIFLSGELRPLLSK